MLVLSLTLIVGIYQKKIGKIQLLISVGVSRLQLLKDQLDKLVLAAQFMKLEHEKNCDDLLNPDNGATFPGSGTGPGGTGGPGGLGGNLINGNNIGSLAGGMSLEDLIAHTEMLYGDVLQDLKARGDKKALERISLLQKDMTEWKQRYNISFKIIKI